MKEKSLTQYMLVNQVLISGLSNMLINGLIAVLIKRQSDAIRFFGENGVAAGLVVMAFLLPLILTVINSKNVERGIKAGKLFFGVTQYKNIVGFIAQKPYWLIGLSLGCLMAIMIGLVLLFIQSDISYLVLDVAQYGLLVGSIACLLYTSPSPRDYAASRMPSSA